MFWGNLSNSNGWITSSRGIYFGLNQKEPREVYAFYGVFGTHNQNSLPFCNGLNDFRPRSDIDWNLDDNFGECLTKTTGSVGNRVQIMEREIGARYIPTWNLLKILNLWQLPELRM
ncbi:unnamed protein product [Ilex paraguariensis]|uniref:Uncharacterized protein n=1 Tax=Ilex paraguariensis TaxID=185542 RepID=A0ABC8SXH2_9AQUA